MFTLNMIQVLGQEIKFIFGTINTLKNSDKEQWIYGGYRITFDSAGLCLMTLL